MPSVANLVENNRLIVWNTEDGNSLYSDGYYGKPLGIPKPREKFDTPLVLDAVEGLYLAEAGRLTVRDLDDKKISPKKLAEKFGEGIQGFETRYRVYKDLRTRGLVATPGIKYGCDFAVYERGPGIEHAPYIVQVWYGGACIEAAEIIKAGRLATTVRKSFMLAVVGEEIVYLMFDWWKA
ncbi:MAG TPA: tRNA-intron lyase [Candidatus Bathyarchaeia archaeon]